MNNGPSIMPTTMNNNKKKDIGLGPTIIKKPVETGNGPTGPTHYGPSRIIPNKNTSVVNNTPRPTQLPKKINESNNVPQPITSPNNSFNNKPSIQHIGSVSSIPNSTKPNGVNSQYVDKNIGNYGQFSLYEYNQIKDLVNHLDFSSLRSVLDFGDIIQRKYAELHSQKLSLTSNGYMDIETHLDEIAKIVNFFNYDDLIKNNSSIWNNLFSGLSIKDKLKLSIKSIEASAQYVEQMLPEILLYIEKLQNLEKKFIEVDKDIRCHIIALNLIIKYSNEELKNQSNDILNDILDKRLKSLLQSSIDNQSVPMEINLMKITLVSKAEVAKDTILGLVSTWKSHCATALTILENNKSLGSVAGDIIATKDKLLKALDKK